VYGEQVIGISNIALTPTSIDENAVDPEMTLQAVGANSATFALVSGVGSDDNSRFAIVGNKLRFNGAANFEAKSAYTVRVKATATTGSTYEKALAIAVNDLNEPPTVLYAFGAPITIPDGATFGSTTPGTYSTVAGTGGSGNGYITQDSYGRIAWTGTPNLPPPQYAFTARFQNNQTQEQFVTILLLENNPNPTTVANLSNDDPDTNATATYSLIAGIGGDDNAVFSISGSNLIINATTDYETKNEYKVRIRVTTDGGLYVDLPLRVNIVQMPEQPNDINLSATTLGEVGGIIGTISTIDPDNVGSYTYTIVGGSLAGYLAIGTGGNANKLILNSPLDGGQIGYDVLIRSTDEAGFWVQKSFTLSYSNNSLFPQIATTTSTALYVTNTIVSMTILDVVNTESVATTSPYNYFILQN
jgi:hypothetical protein